MDRKQRFAKYDRLMIQIQGVLGHYSCPESCNASCCKKHYINFYRKEYEKILKNVDKESTNIIKSSVIKSGSPEFYKTIPAVTVCPLLIDSKCRIYGNRPESCRKFPFETIPDLETGFVLRLVLCSLSVNIVRDYAQWYKLIDSEKCLKLYNVFEQYKNIIGSVDSYVQILESNLDSFISFLERE